MSLTIRTQAVISYATAADLVQGALSHAEDNGWAVAAVAVDPWGAVVASGRMDGVPAPILEFATDKAYTAILGNPTRDFNERTSSGKGLELGMVNRPRLCAWEGGLPVFVEGALIGALGVSGAAGPEDAACATVAVARLQAD